MLRLKLLLNANLFSPKMHNIRNYLHLLRLNCATCTFIMNEIWTMRVRMSIIKSKAWMKLPQVHANDAWEISLLVRQTNFIFSITTFSIQQLFNIMTLWKSKVFHYLWNKETGKSTTHKQIFWIKSMHAHNEKFCI